MANLQPYDPTAMTAACNRFPRGKKLLVCGPRNCVRVEVTDRMRDDNRIDLSEKAFKDLGLRGLTPVRVYP